jgi:hypothetical protein
MQRSEAFRLILRLAGFLPLVFAMALGNWALNTAVVLRWEMRDANRAADAMLQGQSIWTDEDGALKFASVARLPRPRDVLIFGGSRAAQISASWFSPNSALNLAFATGGLDDAVSLFEECAELKRVPRLAVLELDPQLVHERLPPNWSADVYYFNNALARYGLKQGRSGDGLLSADRLKSGLQLLAGIQWKTVPAGYAGFHVLPDGSWGLPLAVRNPDPAEMDAFVAANLGKLDADMIRWRTTSRPGEFARELLRHFLDDLQSHHTRVVVFLAPIHPLAYEFYRKRGGYDDSWIRAEMASRGITVAGSYSPYVTRATSGDFMDEAHPRAPIVYRLLREAGVVGTPLHMPSS